VEGIEIDIFGKMTMEKKIVTYAAPSYAHIYIPISKFNGYFEDMMNFNLFAGYSVKFSNMAESIIFTN
jgi:hypothetical protein